MVYGSSISVYGEQRGITIDESTAVRPVLPYAVNKLYGERMCASYAKMYGLQYDTIRISDVYGARDRRRNAVNSFIDAVLAGTPITIHGGGSQRRNFSLVTDIASGLRNVMAQPAGSATYILSDPLAMSVRELAEAVASLIDSEIEIISAGDPDTRDYVFDPSSFQQCFGQIDWTPLRAGLERCLVYRRRTR
jgi:UDP-glucose 4-epimerase